MLRGLRNFLNMDRMEKHSTDRLKERGLQKGSGRHSTLRGIVSRAALGDTVERRGGARMGLSER